MFHFFLQKYVIWYTVCMYFVFGGRVDSLSSSPPKYKTQIHELSIYHSLFCHAMLLYCISVLRISTTVFLSKHLYSKHLYNEQLSIRKMAYLCDEKCKPSSIRVEMITQHQERAGFYVTEQMSRMTWNIYHYNDVIMGVIASQITNLTIVYSIVYSDADQRKHQSSASLAFVRGIHRGPANSPHKWPVTRKMFPFDDVVMT